MSKKCNIQLLGNLTSYNNDFPNLMYEQILLNHNVPVWVWYLLNGLAELFTALCKKLHQNVGNEIS